MKIVVQEVNNKMMRYALNDDDDQEEAVEIGIDIGVPSLEQIDWSAVEIELHNRLFDARLFTLDDVAAREGVLSNVILAVLKRKIVSLYKE